MNWIDASEKTPPIAEPVIGWGMISGDKKMSWHEVFLSPGGRFRSVRFPKKGIEVIITHWMPGPVGPFRE